HDLDERNAGPIEVDGSRARVAVVNRLAGILFHVQARYADLDVVSVLVFSDGDGSPSRERLIDLRDLVTARQVGIEIILAREYGDGIDSASEPECRSRCQLDSLLVQNRQRARQGQAHRTGV